jgi:hypothetical protein
MRNYRLYLLTADHHMKPPIIVTCDDDEQAMERMGHTVAVHGAELWDGPRLVLRTSSQAPPQKD